VLAFPLWHGQEPGHSRCTYLKLNVPWACCLSQTACGANKLLKPPVEPARLPYTAGLIWQSALWEALSEGVASLADFIGHPWRPSSLAADAHHIIIYPSPYISTLRSAPIQEVNGRW
jgi:hypothetical protein